jgi:hypothetical protein
MRHPPDVGLHYPQRKSMYGVDHPGCEPGILTINETLPPLE